MAPKEKEFREEIWRIWEILIVAKECFQYSYYLHFPDTKEEAEYLSYSQDFGFISHILWRMTIIELSKLFSSSSKRDRFNLQHFISKLKISGYFSNIGISEVTLDKWDKDFIAKAVSINNLLTLRDKIYAHTDSKKEDYTKVDLTFKDVQSLINLVEDIVQEIYLVVFDAGTDMSTPIFDRINFNIIRILAEEKRKKIEEILGPDIKFKK